MTSDPVLLGGGRVTLRPAASDPAQLPHMPYVRPTSSLPCLLSSSFHLIGREHLGFDDMFNFLIESFMDIQSEWVTFLHFK